MTEAIRRDTGSLESDVLIVGGGLAGGAMACAVAQSGMSAIVVDIEDPATVLAAGFDGRASAISLSSQRLLEGIGAWSAMEPEACPMLDIRVADGQSPLFLHYDHNDIGDEPFGHMIENRVIRRGIIERMRSLDQVRLLAPARLVGLERGSGGVQGRLVDGTGIKARLAITADGRGSRVRSDAGIAVTRWSYNQVGIVCTVAHERPHDNIAHEHFLPAGPFAILPLNGNRCSIVWTERADLAPALMDLDDAGFVAELRQRFGDFLGTLSVVGPRWSYPLSLQFAERYVDRRLVLVGDAAHGMHPIAGQGLNMGYRDVAALAEVLTDARRLGFDVGDAAVLARFERWRRFDNTLMLAMTDALNRLFSNDIPPVRLARDIGLAAVNRMPLLKRLFMRHAMGIVGELPRFMRGQPL